MKKQTNNTVPPVPLARLVRCLWALGWNLGWRYWRLENACFVDASLARRIAEDAEQMAKQYRSQAVNAKTEEWWTLATRRAECHESWAKLVRKCHAEYSANAEVKRGTAPA